MLYLGSDEPLPLVEWSEDDPTFHLSKLELRDTWVTPHLSSSHLYEAGSNQGCGCGFQFEEPIQAGEEERERRRNMNELAAYIATHVHSGKAICLWGCWDGDQIFESIEPREISTDELKMKDFYFIERQLVWVRPN